MKSNERMRVIVGVAIVVVTAAVAWHSVQEIHYLKSFYPDSFTVGQARDAAVVELIKVALIITPLLAAWRLLAGRPAHGAESTSGDSQAREPVAHGDSDEDGRREMIVAHLREHGEITNNDIERLLGVSDATAGRILQELEDEGMIEQHGTTGRGVYYRLINGS